MPPRFQRVLKTAQTLLPWTRAIKFNAYNIATRRFGVHTEPEFPLLAALGKVSVAIDVGGNWGQSIEAIRYYAKPDLIVSFEPNPPLAARLSRVYARDANVSIKPFGLASTDATATLYTPIYGRFVFDGATSFDEHEAVSFLNADRMAWFDRKKLVVEEAVCAIKRLDDLDLSPQVAKLDVQGFELEVLKGGAETFRRCRPFTILENPTEDVVNFFRDLDMPPYILNSGNLIKGETSGNNTIFMTSEQETRLERHGLVIR